MYDSIVSTLCTVIHCYMNNPVINTAFHEGCKICNFHVLLANNFDQLSLQGDFWKTIGFIMYKKIEQHHVRGAPLGWICVCSPVIYAFTLIEVVSSFNRITQLIRLKFRIK